MGRDSDAHRISTRREYLKYGGIVAGGGLLAGCSGDSSGSNGTSGSSGGTTAGAASTAADTDAVTGTEGSTGTEGTSGTDESTGTESGTTAGGSYSVTMSPMGEVAFEGVPEKVYTGLPNTVDMAVAAGQADGIDALYYPEEHGTLLNRFYDRLDGVSLDWQNLTDSWGIGKEKFYQLGSDVHLTDPAYASTLDSLDRSDVTEIDDQIGPWFGNYYSSTHASPPDAWAEGYEYYSLWQIFEKVAQVFGVGDRGSALRDVHASMISTIESTLPAKSERPSVALTFPGEEDTFWIYHLNADGFLTAHTRPLGAKDAFADVQFDTQKQVDYEAMLEADPDAILVLFTMASSYSISDIKSALESNDVAAEFSAVKNDRVYAQGARFQGPVMNLFQTEMTAKQLYPDQFGAWPGYTDGEPYPAIPQGERLFDRGKVSAIITGNA